LTLAGLPLLDKVQMVSILLASFLRSPDYYPILHFSKVK